MSYLVHTIIHFTLNFIASERERMKSHDSHMTIVETMETGDHCLMLCFDILKVIYDSAVSVAPEVSLRHHIDTYMMYVTMHTIKFFPNEWNMSRNVCDSKT